MLVYQRVRVTFWVNMWNIVQRPQHEICRSQSLVGHRGPKSGRFCHCRIALHWLIDIGIPISISYFMKSPINDNKPGRYHYVYIYIIIIYNYIYIYIAIVSYNYMFYFPHGYYPLAII